MNLNSHRSPCCDSDEQRSAVNNTSNEYNQTEHDLMARVLRHNHFSKNEKRRTPSPTGNDRFHH